MKQAILCTVKSHRGKISRLEIGVKPMNGNDVPMTKIEIEIPTSDFDYQTLQVSDQAIVNNVEVNIDGCMIPKDQPKQLA